MFLPPMDRERTRHGCSYGALVERRGDIVFTDDADKITNDSLVHGRVSGNHESTYLCILF
jgi:hypothetical protein